MKIIAVIPARYESARFPAKVLARKTGKYLIQHTFEQVQKAHSITDCFIAADDEKIMAACEQFGAKCIMTDRNHKSGTDRIAEAAEKIEADIIVNIQADEPEINPADIDLLSGLLVENPAINAATLVTKFDSKEQIADANIVKVVTGRDKCAKYFSRSVIPYCRDSGGIGNIDDYLRHLGVYAYRRDFLMRITKLPQTKLEKLEKLEQLRLIEHGFSILTGLVAHSYEGIDTEKQYNEFVKRQIYP